MIYRKVSTWWQEKLSFKIHGKNKTHKWAELFTWSWNYDVRMENLRWDKCDNISMILYNHGLNGIPDNWSLCLMYLIRIFTLFFEIKGFKIIKSISLEDYIIRRYEWKINEWMVCKFHSLVNGILMLLRPEETFFFILNIKSINKASRFYFFNIL